RFGVPVGGLGGEGPEAPLLEEPEEVVDLVVLLDDLPGGRHVAPKERRGGADELGLDQPGHPAQVEAEARQADSFHENAPGTNSLRCSAGIYFGGPAESTRLASVSRGSA